MHIPTEIIYTLLCVWYDTATDSHASTSRHVTESRRSTIRLQRLAAHSTSTSGNYTLKYSKFLSNCVLPRRLWQYALQKCSPAVRQRMRHLLSVLISAYT